MTQEDEDIHAIGHSRTSSAVNNSTTNTQLLGTGGLNRIMPVESAGNQPQALGQAGDRHGTVTSSDSSASEEAASSHL